MSSVRAPAEAPLRHVAVVGLGVMGGSLARALSARTEARVWGWSPVAEERQAAREAGAVQEAPRHLEDALPGAELVVLATPLAAVCELLPEAARRAPEALLTDVASLKAPVEAAAREAGLGERWVGSHPMAGSEGSGFDAGREDLYEGARVWLVADASAGQARERVAALWRAVGARPAATGAAEHDRLMARASHLPQLTANALARVLEAAGVPRRALGPGGRDMTRLAASASGMWADLLARAPDALPDALDALAAELATMADELRAGRVDGVTERMERTARWTAGAGEPAPGEGG